MAHSIPRSDVAEVDRCRGAAVINQSIYFNSGNMAHMERQTKTHSKQKQDRMTDRNESNRVRREIV